jgi:hypothetical protein
LTFLERGIEKIHIPCPQFVFIDLGLPQIWKEETNAGNSKEYTSLHFNSSIQCVANEQLLFHFMGNLNKYWQILLF